MIVEPMLAAPMPKKPLNLAAGEYVAEEKFDGHRVIVHLAFGKIEVWSRLGNRKIVGPHVEAVRDALPSGIYDGELIVPGKRSYNVTELDEFKHQVFVAFDMLHIGNISPSDMRDIGLPNLIDKSYSERSLQLSYAIAEAKSAMRYTDKGEDAWRAADIHTVSSTEQLTELLSSVWKRDGEGLILKRLAARYEPGKRPKTTWLKMKQLKSAVLTLIGFQAGKMGAQATQILLDDEGHTTTVKWKNLELLSRFNAMPSAFIGRKVRIEFQERTSDGNYRHPRWDRFEDE